MQTENKRSFIINIVYLTIIALIVYFTLKYAIFAVMPFIIAFIVAAVMQPPIRFCKKKLRMKGKLASALVIVLFLCTAGLLLALIAIEVVIFIRDNAHRILPYYQNTLQPALESLLGSLQNALREIDTDIVLDYDTVLKSFGSTATRLVDMLASKTGNIVTSLPGILLSVLITVISMFFISADYDMLTRWCVYQLPEKKRKSFIEIKNYVVQIIAKYIRSYALILLITFGELCIMFLIAGLIISTLFSSVGTTILCALLIAMFDILPIVGTGTILVPWILIELVQGKYSVAVALAVIYLIVLVVRNIIEPKIIGQQVGLHPVVTLIGMIVGTTLFGVIGLFGLPITLALLKDLNDRGKIHLFSYPPRQAEAEETEKPVNPDGD